MLLIQLQNVQVSPRQVGIKMTQRKYNSSSAAGKQKNITPEYDGCINIQNNLLQFYKQAHTKQ